MSAWGVWDSVGAGTKLDGVVPGEPVTVVMATPHGDDAVHLVYRGGDGMVAERILYRTDASAVSVHHGAGRPFDADAADFRLAAEAQRILMAGRSDPMLAVSTSDVRPLPHQLRAVYGELLPRTPLRFLLADDPGAGKTIMAGLYIKEMLLRDDVRRCLIVAPGSLVEQWQDELRLKFGLSFDLLAPGASDVGPGANVFEARPLLIARMDQLARNDALLSQLGDAEFDLVVVDEAHRMSAHWFGGELKPSKRFGLGQFLGERTRHMLLMTATPHNGKEEDFQSFLSLLDRDRFAGPSDKHPDAGVADGFMRRMVKEDLLTFDGKPLFPERHAETASYPLSDPEMHLYEEVTAYVRDGMNRADRVGGRRRNTVGFALTVLQRRLASSPEAIYQSLRRRAARLEKTRDDLVARHGAAPAPAPTLDLRFDDQGDLELDDYDAEELETAEDELVDAATAALTVAELEAEVADLHRLTALAQQLVASEQDSKWVELRGVLEGRVLTHGADAPRKLIVFSEHRDTLEYLERRVSSLIGKRGAVVSIHGGVPRERRRWITEEFSKNPDVQVLIATDAAGEGLNLQAAHLMVNYDLPWNPNRIEQRFGRIHRIGQEDACYLWNIVAEGTREGEVYRRLLDKIDEQRQAYGGKVFDVLGTSLGGMRLSDLLRQAIREGESPEVRERSFRTIDESVSAGITELIRDHALTHEALPPDELHRLRRDMEDALARRLQPHFIQDAFLEAFKRLGGQIERREHGTFEILHVPAAVRSAAHGPVARRYQRVTFDVGAAARPGSVGAELVAPGQPLHDTVLQMTVQALGDTLDRGTVFESESVDQPALLVGVVNEVRDGIGEVIAQRFGYSISTADGSVIDAGPAPHLDFAPGDLDDAGVIAQVAAREDAATSWMIEHQLPGFAAETIARRTRECDKLADRVERRLNHEINRLGIAALKADDDARAGRKVRISAESLRRRADDLEARLHERMTLIGRQRSMAPSPPRVVSAAIVVPAQRSPAEAPSIDAAARKAVERRGVDAVLDAERALGRTPTEQPYANPGFDILSTHGDDPSIRIEVKARVMGSSSFTITRTEMITALNTLPHHRLALVSVSADGPDHDEVRYVEDAFAGADASLFNDFGVVAQTLSWNVWWQRGRAPF